MIIKRIALASMLGALVATACPAGEAGAPVDVAPKAEGTHKQAWAAAAWCDAAKIWLVAWREGDLNAPETGTDIWCARVSDDGKALDPAGVRLTKGKGLKDHPRVASDGKAGFLVVWEDLSNGKDWDVRGARVSAEGKALDPDGILIGGDPASPGGSAAAGHNQARPDVAFTGGSYLVVWQAFHSTGAGDPGIPAKETGYAINAARVSTEGKASEAKTVDVAPGTAGQLTEPSLAARGDDALVTSIVSFCGGFGCAGLGWRMLDGKTGEAKGAGFGGVARKGNFPVAISQDAIQQPAALAMGEGGALAVVRDSKQVYRWHHAFSVCRLDASGAPQGEPLAIGEGGGTAFWPRCAAAFDGERYLLVMDWTGAGKDVFQTEIHGWFVGADGKLDGDPKTGFVIAADAGKSDLIPAVSAGPKGTSLVVYSQVRGVEDMKLVVRIVK
jgi:hypothetical protein